jgi:hypothetical protein
MNRTQRILAVVLGLQIVLIAVVFWPRAGEVQAGEALLGSLDTAQVTRIIIDDTDGNSITLVKSGGTWVLPDADDYPAQADKIETMLQNLAGIETNRLITRTAASHERLGVAADEYERRIRLEGSGGASAVLYVGTSSGVGATHVRLDGQDEVFLTGEINSFDVGASPSNWIDTAFVSLPGDQVTGMVLENANGTYEFEKDAVSGEWSLIDMPEGRQLNSSQVTSLANRLATLRMLQPLGKQEQTEYGLDKPNAIVTLVATDENGATTTYTIEVGAISTEGDNYFVRSSGSDYIVLIAGSSLDDVVNDALEDFLQEVSTPTPGS